MTAPVVSIGIPTYCGAELGENDLLGMCLRAIRLRTCTEIPYEIVVVDDSGKLDHQNKSEALARQFGARWLAHRENRGVAAGWNTLVRSASTPFNVLLNDDFYVSRGWLDALVYFLRENPKAGSGGLHAYFCLLADVPRLLTSADATIIPREYFTKREAPEYLTEHHGREQPGRVMAPPGCGFGMSREKYDLIGGFDESLGKAFYEESDAGTSLASKGFPTYALQWPACYTIMSATFGRSPELTAGGDVFAGPRAKYIAKWNGHTEVTHPRYMDKIPFQKVRWLDPNGPREELITGEHGFHETE
jgi:GT2 family glycosyltransferase